MPGNPLEIFWEARTPALGEMDKTKLNKLQGAGAPSSREASAPESALLPKARSCHWHPNTKDDTLLASSGGSHTPEAGNGSVVKTMGQGIVVGEVEIGYWNVAGASCSRATLIPKAGSCQRQTQCFCYICGCISAPPPGDQNPQQLVVPHSHPSDFDTISPHQPHQPNHPSKSDKRNNQ